MRRWRSPDSESDVPRRRKAFSMIRRLARVFSEALALVAVAAVPVAATAQTWPAKPIRIVVPFAPGGGNAVFAWQLATWLGETLKQ